ncbi:MAG: ribosome small subunit-dependent GTPase A [Myxococcota bacterium]|nr:ribosome small subunit-dependent GTPase A [Myxococcota bacterium]
MQLESIGWSPAWATAFQDWLAAHGGNPETHFAARVAEERRGRCRLLGERGPLEAGISGRLRYMASGPEDLPAVGDWVAASADAAGSALIHGILPRVTALIRKAPERPARAQVLASNLDAVWLVTSVNRDFNPRRIERTLALVRESGARPVLVLSKVDLDDGRGEPAERDARNHAPGVPVFRVSALENEGLVPLVSSLGPGESVALIGSSGVGKSTLANQLLGRELLATREIRADDDRGRHTTTHRQLLPLPGGGVLIDTPGIREVALWGDAPDSSGAAFPEIEALIGSCRFHDCGHRSEPGCAVQAALEDGRIEPDRLRHYQKLEREARHVARQRDAQARHEQRKKAKAFARSVRRRPGKRDF